MNNISFDLETLGNNFNSPIVQIGAVKFHDDGDIDSNTFLVNIDLNDLERRDYGFTMDLQTVQWWLNQEPEAIKSVFSYDLDRISLSHALYKFASWIGKTSDYYYWSHSTFDPVILQNTYDKLKLVNPIPFRLHRDIRTLTYFSGRIETTREGVHHNALDDAIFQAKYIAKGINKIKKND